MFLELITFSFLIITRAMQGQRRGGSMFTMNQVGWDSDPRLPAPHCVDLENRHL